MYKGILKLTLGFALLALARNDSFAQADQRAYDLQNVIPPSPNSASIGKYVNWPVNQLRACLQSVSLFTN